jgi:Pentapeptide repeats (8 copies)
VLPLEPLWEPELATLRRRIVALSLALRLEDFGVAAVVSGRLARSMASARRLLADLEVPLPTGAAAMMRSHLRAAERLQVELPAIVTPRDLHRLQRWVAAPPSLGAAGARADLFELDGRNKDLRLGALSQLHLLQCQLAGARLHRASFCDSVLDGCDLTSVDARGSLWRGAVVMQGRLRGAGLAEAQLAGALFSDCDLRGADLSASRGAGNGATGSMWIRCDLRDTRWTRRALAGAHFVACRLDGVRDFVLASDTVAVRCQPPLEGPPPLPQARQLSRRRAEPMSPPAPSGASGALRVA